eukprot:11176566-Lingulodinium_polyedra.AAC.1
MAERAELAALRARSHNSRRPAAVGQPRDGGGFRGVRTGGPFDLTDLPRPPGFHRAGARGRPRREDGLLPGRFCAG